jgi:lysophospholipase L1-like esterase
MFKSIRVAFALWLSLVFVAPLFAADATSPAAVPTEATGWHARHEEKLKLLHEHKYDLLLVGDSITHNLDNPAFKKVWDEFYAPRNALALGYSGERTENILWNLQNGELDNQFPKAVVLLIGTNNTDDANYPVVSTPEQVAEGTAAIIKTIREKCPQTKILLLRIFPRTNRYTRGSAERGSAQKRFDANLRASELVAKLADGDTVHYLDVNHVFHQLDGSLDPKLMPDQLHPSPDGARLWAKAMDAKLAELMGTAKLDTDPQPNNAVVPVPKLEQDSYDWYKRHESEIAAGPKINPQVILIGDSITHFWSGEPSTGQKNGPKSWDATFAGLRVMNMGFGWDRTQNVLWRIDHGEMDGLRPDFVVIHIGTNNFAGTGNCRESTPAEIAEGIKQIMIRVRAKSPGSKIILMGVFPRDEKAADPMRAKIKQLNALLAEYGKAPGITYLDITDRWLQPDGSIARADMGDFLHPTDQGYAIWGKAIKEAMAMR